MLTVYIQDYEDFKQRVADKFTCGELVEILGLPVGVLMEEMYDTLRPLFDENPDDFGDLYD